MKKMQIGKWIKGWRLDKFFNHLFSDNHVENDIAIQKAVELVERLKSFVDKPQIDIVTNLIPGNWDAALVSKVRYALPFVIGALVKGQICNDKPTLEEKLACVVALATTKSNDEKAKFWHSLASDFARILSDGKITISDAFILVEIAYRELVKNKA